MLNEQKIESIINEAIKTSQISEKKSSYEDIRDWVFDKLENSDMDSDEMKKACIKKFGKGSEDDYENAVSEYMD